MDTFEFNNFFHKFESPTCYICTTVNTNGTRLPTTWLGRFLIQRSKPKPAHASPPSQIKVIVNTNGTRLPTTWLGRFLIQQSKPKPAHASPPCQIKVLMPIVGEPGIRKATMDQCFRTTKERETLHVNPKLYDIRTFPHVRLKNSYLNPTIILLKCEFSTSYTWSKHQNLIPTPPT